ncbi:YciI family protein [Desulfonatronospira sp.]|uniref:YciI family protein n=1 Tax=Desulfonatronospira sp. TaxID=1962951 RepID=UPI0025B9C769|nr:YciI family protein [Desulfonatronospira sp.]
MVVFIGKDKPGGLEIRQAQREKHVAMLKDLQARGLIHFAGPLLDDRGEMNGSLIIFDTEDVEKVKSIMDQDPYVQAGLFASREAARVKKVM